MKGKHGLGRNKKQMYGCKGKKDHMGLKIALLVVALLLLLGAVYYFAFYLPAQR